MAGSVEPESTNPIIVDVESAAEDTPLLGEIQPQERTRRSSSVVGNTDHGYHKIPGSIPEESIPQPEYDFWQVLGILSVLLIGVFISQTDGTLLIANIANITSKFNELQNSGWLISSFSLAMCVAQPLYGKLSDIFGRKLTLQIAYFLFALGGAVCGLGRSMTEVIIGRVIQGSGGAGMVSLVSILITDLVPLREVAAYRSYVNIVATAGRSCGGPLGGALAQTIGWRWAFIGQAPLTFIAMILVAWKLQIKPKNKPGARADESQTLGSKLKRIDFLGALFMSSTILSAMLILDMGGQKVPWVSPLMAILGGITVLAGTLFYVIEKHFAKEPIFPLKLLSHKAVVLSYLTFAVQISSQMALMLYIPLYFQVTKNSSPAEAGAYLIPSVLGNTVGGLLSGSYVKRTGRYKPLLILCGLSAMFCFTLLLTTWHGHTPVWQALFVFFGGFATGIAGSAVFVNLAASVEESEMAIASSGLYLSSNIGAVAGVTVASTVFSNSLKSKLDELLANWPHGHKIADKAASNVDYVQKLTGKVHEVVVSAYVYAFRQGFVFSLVCASFTLIFALLVKEKRLGRH